VKENGAARRRRRRRRRRRGREVEESLSRSGHRWAAERSD